MIWAKSARIRLQEACEKRVVQNRAVNAMQNEIPPRSSRSLEFPLRTTDDGCNCLRQLPSHPLNHHKTNNRILVYNIINTWCQGQPVLTHTATICSWHIVTDFSLNWSIWKNHYESHELCLIFWAFWAFWVSRPRSSWSWPRSTRCWSCCHDPRPANIREWRV